MLRSWESAKACSRRQMSRESQRRIFCVNPSKERPAFIGIRSDKCDARWRWQHRHRRGINNLENIKAEGVRDQRQHQERCKHRLLPPGRIPTKQKRFACNLGGNAIHRGGVAARATEVIPCSSAAFVTSATVSYDAERSALIIIDWSLRFAASSSCPSCSMVTRWS